MYSVKKIQELLEEHSALTEELKNEYEYCDKNQIDRNDHSIRYSENQLGELQEKIVDNLKVFLIPFFGDRASEKIIKILSW